jgi:uncharacterized membrane protein
MGSGFAPRAPDGLRSCGVLSRFGDAMAEVSLEFQAASDTGLHLLLLLAVSLVLLGYGAWQVARGRARAGLISLGASVGAIAPALLVDGVLQHTRSDRRGWASIAWARIVATLATSLTIAGVVLLRHTPRAVWMLLLMFQLLTAVGIIYAGVYAYLGSRRLAALTALRGAAVVALLLILFKPALGFRGGPARQRALLPILVDRSGSMGTVDGPRAPNRYRKALQGLLTQRERIAEHCEPRWYHFAQECWAAESLGVLHELGDEPFPGDGTDVAGALRHATRRYDHSELAGVLLLSDGIHTAGSIVTDAAVSAGVPIYIAAVGSSDESATVRRNAELLALDAPRVAIRDHATSITARVRLNGMPGETVEVRLLEEGSVQPTGRVTLRAEGPSQVLSARFLWTPRGEGQADRQDGADLRAVRVEIASVLGESSEADNAAALHLLVTRPSLRILYIEGSIRPEYKFLRRRLDSDPNLQFAALVRVSENRFWSYGGVKGQRLTDLPKTDEDFGLFDVLILGDLDSSFLSPGQMARIRRFVNDGGGLLMLGGRSSFGPGGYGGTDIEAVLPVLAGSRLEPQETTPFLPQLTAAGQAHPILEGLGDFFPLPGRPGPAENAARLPDLLGCVTVPQARATASVLAVHPSRRNETGPLTVLAVQRFGAGRSAAFTADTTWRWYMPLRATSGEGPYERFWAQFVRWLAHSDTRTRQGASSVILRSARGHTRVGEPIGVTLRVADHEGRPAGEARVLCELVDKDGTVRGQALLSPAPEAGVFAGDVRPETPGVFRLCASAADKNGAELGTDELPLEVLHHSEEMDRLARDDRLLGAVAEVTGGAMEDVLRLPELVDRIVDRGRGEASASKARIVRLYSLSDRGDFGMLFCVLVALLTAEWLLRRRWQLS